VHGRVGPPVAVRAGPGRAGPEQILRFHLSIRTATTALPLRSSCRSYAQSRAADLP
jgi:hypothetical protein